MITTSTAPFEVVDGAQQKFDGSSILCEPTYLETQSLFHVTLNILDSATTVGIGYGYVEVTTAEVDAQTGTGTGETAPWFNALQKAVIAKLGAYTGNGSTVFTIV